MKSNHIKLLTGIFLFALGIRIGFLLLFPEVGWLNYQYDTIGWNLAQGHGYSMDPEPPYTPSAYRPPVYPFMLAAVYAIFGHSYAAAKGLQAIIGALTCILIYLIALNVFDRRTGIIAALVSEVYPAFLFYVNMLVMEVVLIFLVAVTIYLFVKVVKHKTLGYQIALGASIAIASLCRPIMLLFPLIVLAVIYYVYRNKGLALRHFGVMFATTVMVLTPWSVRNYLVFHKFIPVVSKGTGEQLWFGLYLAKENPHDLEAKLFTAVKAKRDSITAGLSHMETEKELQRLALREIMENPLAYVGKAFLKMGKLWYHPIGAIRTLPRYSQTLANFLIIAYYIMLLLALGGIVRVRHKFRSALPLIAVIAYFTIIHSLLYVVNRYRVAALPYVIIFASYALSQVLPTLSKMSRGIWRSSEKGVKRTLAA